MTHNKSFLPRCCRICKKWQRGWYLYDKKKTGESIILCKNCHLVLMCSPLFDKN